MTRQPARMDPNSEEYRFYRYVRTMDFGAALDRLVQPLNDALDYTGIITNRRKYVLLFFLREMAERKRSFWGWTTEEWIESIDARLAPRQRGVAIAYLLCGFSELRPFAQRDREAPSSARHLLRLRNL